MAGGDGTSGTGTSTVPFPSVVVAGDSGDAGVVSGALVSTVTSTDVVGDVVDVVVVVVSSPAESPPPHAVNKANAHPDASAVRVDLAAAREVMQHDYPVAGNGNRGVSRARPFRP
ncbi:hypothetical protein [Mycobacterium neumannii]|uniref:hypothetical protein n=1 Tax=Mycobacterium neumannii TaxID=2048551 RepID=UPI003AB7C8E4